VIGYLESLFGLHSPVGNNFFLVHFRPPWYVITTNRSCTNNVLLDCLGKFAADLEFDDLFCRNLH
jgi:hypothetical protein